MHFRLAILIVLITCSTSLFSFVTAQALPRDLKTWTLEYSLTGGKAGLDRHLRLTEAGELKVGNSEGRGSRVTTHASLELMAKIADYLKIAQKARSTSGGPSPDALYTSLIVTSASAKYELEVPDDIARLLAGTMDLVLRKAFVGTWWQSAWKLCHPAAQLTAAEFDPPIESLVFQDDGRFSATWQGEGARVFGAPSAPSTLLPDYSGRYSIEPAYSYISMRFESGIYTPRDFSGDGHFQINGDKLVLQNIWLGTKQAKHKPDICELTFTREPAHPHGSAHKQP